MKTIVLRISKTFPASHVRHGQPTELLEKLLKSKIHTIRENYDYWKQKAELINSGKAILSIRCWSGLPFRSKQTEIMRLTKIDIQAISLAYCFADGVITAQIDGEPLEDIGTLSHNDGLSVNDFRSWFFAKENEFNGVIIHFTDLRY